MKLSVTRATHIMNDTLVRRFWKVLTPKSFAVSRINPSTIPDKKPPKCPKKLIPPIPKLNTNHPIAGYKTEFILIGNPGE